MTTCGNCGSQFTDESEGYKRGVCTLCGVQLPSRPTFWSHNDREAVLDGAILRRELAVLLTEIDLLDAQTQAQRNRQAVKDSLRGMN